MKKYLVLPFFIFAIGLMSGCITQLKSDIMPGTDLSALKRIYVVRLMADQRGVEKLIADRLNLMGYQATAGESVNIPADADAVVTYQDKWMWDITMYMIQLDVQVRQPKTQAAIASGHALRTSLARKSPPDMVEEVLNDLFKKPANENKK
jgi:hypothetical protein